MLYAYIILLSIILFPLLFSLLQKKSDSFKEYVLASSSLDTGVLVMTLVATVIASGDLKNPGFIYRDGIVSFLFPLTFFCSFLMVGLWIAPKLALFEECFSMGDVMHQLYGHPYIQLFTGAVTAIFSILIVGSQLEAIADFSQEILPVEKNKVILLMGLGVLFYSIAGGMRTVAITDFFQFLALAIALVILTNVVLYKIGGIYSLFDQLPIKKKSLTQPLVLGKLRSCIYYGVMPTYLLTPPIVQRILMAKKPHKARNMFLLSSIFYIVVRIIMLICSLAAIVYFKEEELGNLPTHLLPYLANRLFIEEPLLRTIVLIGFIAIFMSTADSFLHSAGVSLVQDIYIPLFPKQKINNIALSRLNTLMIGLLAIVVALLGKERVPDTLNYYMVLVFAAILLPFILGVIGFKSTASSFCYFIGTYITLLISFKLFHLFCNKWLLAKEWQVIIALFISLNAYLMRHYREHGKFVWVHREEEFLLEKSWHPSWKLKKNQLNSLIKTIFSLPAIARKRVSLYGSQPLLFSLFMIITNMVIYDTDTSNTYALFDFKLRAIVHTIGAFFCLGLMLHSLWPTKWLVYFDFYWFIALTYCIPFVQTLLFLEDPNHTLSVMKLTVMILLLVVLVDYTSFFTLAPIGMMLAFVSYKYTFPTLSLLLDHQLSHPAGGVWWPELSFSVQTQLIAGFLPAILMGLLFASRREISYYEHLHQLAIQCQHAKRQLSVEQANHHQLAHSLDKKSSMMRVIVQTLNQLANDPKNHKDVGKLRSALAHLLLIKEESLFYLPLHPAVFALEELLGDLKKELQYHTLLKQQIIKIHTKLASNKQFVLDKHYIIQLLIDTLQNLYQQNNIPNSSYHLYIESTQLHYAVDGLSLLPGVIIAFSAAPIKNDPMIHSSYDMSKMKKRHLAEKGAGLTSAQQRTLYAHYGCVTIEKDIIYYIFPENINSIRPNLPFFADEDLLERTRLDGEPEEIFLKEIAKNKKLSLPLFKKAIQFIKHYHREQFRYSGESFYTHPLSVATQLLSFTNDQNTLIAAILHDVIEDTAATEHQLAATFGKEIASIVASVSNLHNKKTRKIKLEKINALTKISKKDHPEALLIKLFDRWHNMLTVEGHPSFAKRKKIASETLTYFVPLAHALEQPKVAEELTLLAKRYVQ